MNRGIRSFPGAASAGFLLATLAIASAGMGSSPPGRYTTAGGSVYDTRTKLTWQQNLSGNSYSVASGAAYCASLGGGWRLPTMKELLTIVDLSIPSPGPTIDTVAFPATPAVDFWTSTPYGNTSGYWSVNFSALAPNAETSTNSFRVRCVQ